MKIWQLDCDLGRYDALTGDPLIDMNSFDGQPKKNEWKPIEMKRLLEDDNLPLGDAPGYMMAIFSQRAVTLLAPYLEGGAEVLPVYYEKEQFYIINPTVVLDCLDHDRSQYDTSLDGQMITWVFNYILKPGVVAGHHIFRIKDIPTYPIFVSDEFVQAVKEADLEGFEFKLVWDSEHETEWEVRVVPPAYEDPYWIPMEKAFDQEDLAIFERLKTLYDEHENSFFNWWGWLRETAAQEVLTEGDYFHILPYDYERVWFKKGRIIDDPTDAQDLHQCIFDGEGRIIYRGAASGSQEVCQYDQDEMMVYYYYGNDFRGCELYLPQKNVRYSYKLYGLSKDQYIYDAADQMEKIISYGKNHTDKGLSYWEYGFEFENGELKWIVGCADNAFSRIIYDRDSEYEQEED